MRAKRCNMSITAVFISTSLMLLASEIPMHEEDLNFFSTELYWTKDALVPEACPQTPIYPCQDDDFAFDRIVEFKDAKFEDRPGRRKKNNHQQDS
jgi:hypothetical protein